MSCCNKLSPLVINFHIPFYLKLCTLLHSFLRLSNMLPHTVKKFDTKRHLCVADVDFSDTGAVIILKWSKTRKDRHLIDTIPIPELGRALVCPVAVLQALLQVSAQSRNSPLFQIHPGVPLTDSCARNHLKAICNFLKFPKNITFHDFRHGGATWAFRHRVPVEHIQVQGTWTSQCVWRYTQLPPSSSSQVSDAFRSFLHY